MRLGLAIAAIEREDCPAMYSLMFQTSGGGSDADLRGLDTGGLGFAPLVFAAPLVL